MSDHLPGVYVAAPLFTPEQRALNRRLSKVLSSHFSVILPQEDGFLMHELVDEGASRSSAEERVFKSDLEFIKSAHLVMTVLNGSQVDEGVAFELGFAYSLGKYCIGLKTDVRVQLPWGSNPMVGGALEHIYESVTALEADLDEIQSCVIAEGAPSIVRSS